MNMHEHTGGLSIKFIKYRRLITHNRFGQLRRRWSEGSDGGTTDRKKEKKKEIIYESKNIKTNVIIIYHVIIHLIFVQLH